jgi:hypothetical protein
MAGLVPAIHALLHFVQSKTWMPGTRPGMTAEIDAAMWNRSSAIATEWSQ